MFLDPFRRSTRRFEQAVEDLCRYLPIKQVAEHFGLSWHTVIPDPDGQHLWILDRWGGNQCAGTDLDPILKFDLEGNLVESFGAGLFGFPHPFLPMYMRHGTLEELK